jgi:hypothetical protein
MNVEVQRFSIMQYTFTLWAMPKSHEPDYSAGVQRVRSDEDGNYVSFRLRAQLDAFRLSLGDQWMEDLMFPVTVASTSRRVGGTHRRGLLCGSVDANSG